MKRMTTKLPARPARRAAPIIPARKMPAVVPPIGGVPTAKQPFVDVVEVFDEIEQGSEEWHQLRLGVPTASNFAKIMSQPLNDSEDVSKTRARLMRQMAGERLTGIPAETFSNAAMQRGKDMEADLREAFEFSEVTTVQRVAFVRRTIRRDPLPPLVIGCSPDSLIEEDGVLEIKSMIPDLMIEMAESGKPFPTRHMAQCQGALWVTGRRYGLLTIGYRGMPYQLKYPFERNDGYIAELRQAVEVFDYELRQMVERQRQRGRK